MQMVFDAKFFGEPVHSSKRIDSVVLPRFARRETSV
jgi:hypothetical protein